MRLQDQQEEENIRQAFWKAIKLYGKNQELAETYLDMDRQEEPELLKELKPVDFTASVGYDIPGRARYPQWLQKKNRKEKLGRLVRFLVWAGGSTAWLALTGDSSAGVEAVEKMLLYCTGEQGEAQKAAVRAAICVKRLQRGDTRDTGKLCGQGRENTALFFQAAEFCRDCDGYSATGKRSYARLLLTAMYLRHTPAEVAAPRAELFWNDMILALADLSAFEPQERKALQDFARTAKKDTPFPRRILSIYQKRQEINPAWFTACVFLALRHSERFEILLRLTVAMDFQSRWRVHAPGSYTLDICRGIAGDTWFQERMAEIEEMLPVSDEAYILWALQAGCEETAARMAVKNPEGIRSAVSRSSSEQYRLLMEIVGKANPALYQEMQASYRETFLEKTASELLLQYDPHRETVKGYLLGTRAAGELDGCMKDWEEIFPKEERYGKIALLWELNEKSMYYRAVVVEALWKETAFFAGYPLCPESGLESPASESGSLLFSEQQIEKLLQILEEEQVPLKMQMEALAGICGGVKEKQAQSDLLEFCREVFAGRRQREGKEQWDEGMKAAVWEGTERTRSFALKVLEKLDPEDYHNSVLFCAEDSSKQVRRLFLEACRTHPQWTPEILELLQAKKSKVREAAVLALGELGQPSFLDEIKNALAREKNKKVMGLLQKLAEELETAEEGGSSQVNGSGEERLAAEIFRGGRKQKTEWLQETGLPQVHRADGSSVSREYIYALLTVYGEMDILGRNPDGAKLAKPLVPEELSACMQAVYARWLQTGAEAKKRWVLYPISIHGGEAVVPVLSRQILDWAEHSRGAIAAEAVNALIFNGSKEAFLTVNQLAAKCKFRQIKNAAVRTLSQAAAQLGISREELEDSMVPDLGFDRRMERRLDFGSRHFTVQLTEAMELEIFDSDGKRRKSLPAPGKQDDAEKAQQAAAELKQLKKQLKNVISTQKLRLEQALRTGRFWQREKWTELFVQNPVMHAFATGLIWGVYDQQGMLKDSFRYMEDGSYNRADGNEYEPGAMTDREEGTIGLVHPLELTREDLALWKEQLSEYEISQPIAQLERPVYRFAEEETEEMAVARFENRELDGLVLSAKLLSAGWVRGKILDAGFFSSYYRIDGRFGAELTFSGASVGYESGEVTVEHLYFYRFPDNIGDGGDLERFRRENRCRPEDISPRYYSEVVMEIAGVAEERHSQLPPV